MHKEDMARWRESVIYRATALENFARLKYPEMARLRRHLLWSLGRGQNMRRLTHNVYHFSQIVSVPKSDAHVVYNIMRESRYYTHKSHAKELKENS